MKLSSCFTKTTLSLCIALSTYTQILHAEPQNLVIAALESAQTPADLAEKKSKDEGGEVTLIVTNKTPIPIRVNWVDQDGKEGVSKDTIAAGATLEMGTTFAGHFFRARAIDGNTLLQEFRVKDDGGKFKISIVAEGNPAEMGLEKPIDDNPAPAPNPAPAADAAAHQGGVVVPAKGPEVSIEIARKNLKVNMQQQIDEFMKLHNDARAEVGLPPLTWDPKLAEVAQKWAESLAAKGDDLEHNTSIKYGENLAGYLPQYGERPVHGAQMWYDEIKGYKGQKIGDPEPPVVGHYTQMVWRSTTHVGFGMAMAPSGMVILCANYNPGGNMIGETPY